MDLKSISKFLSYVLRHHPESIDLAIDHNGWAKISKLIEKTEQHNTRLTRDIIQELMEQGDKQRFLLSGDGQYIRAGYGHSIDVDLQMKPKCPPKKLYHGTAKRNVESILREGIKAGNRNFVHLSVTQDEAKNVGSRHGAPVILLIETELAWEAGYDFYQSESEPGIWLTRQVPAEFLKQWR